MDVKAAQESLLTGRAFGVEGDGLVGSAFGDVLRIGTPPFLAFFRSDPDGVRIQAQFVAASDGRGEFIEA